MNNDLSVSVVTPAYNSEDTLVKCIKNVQSQTLSVKEHIIVNDGSTDSTLEILKDAASKFSNIKIISQANSGAGVARNAAISMATGRYIAFLDSDDEWDEKKLENQIKFMSNNNSYMSYGDYNIVNEDSGKIVSFTSPQNTNYYNFLVSCPILCSSVAYDQYYLGKQFMSEIRQGQDWSLWLKITKLGVRANKYPGNMVTYHIMSNSLSSNKIKKLKNMYKIYREHGFNMFNSSVLISIHTFQYVLKTLFINFKSVFLNS